jgi:hypothetical protein
MVSEQGLDRLADAPGPAGFARGLSPTTRSKRGLVGIGGEATGRLGGVAYFGGDPRAVLGLVLTRAGSRQRFLSPPRRPSWLIGGFRMSRWSHN